MMKPNHYEPKKMATRHVVVVDAQEMCGVLRLRLHTTMKCRRSATNDGSYILTMGHAWAVIKSDEPFDHSMDEHRIKDLLKLMESVGDQAVTIEFDNETQRIVISDIIM